MAGQQRRGCSLGFLPCGRCHRVQNEENQGGSRIAAENGQVCRYRANHNEQEQMPSLADLIKQRTETMDLGSSWKPI
jgi:hypothetical protein